MANAEFIVTETPNGSGWVKKAFACSSAEDFIGRISQMAARSGESINTVEQAIEFLDDKHAQRTRVVTRSDFDALAPDSWEPCVLAQAESLGWYEAPAVEDDEE